MKSKIHQNWSFGMKKNNCSPYLSWVKLHWYDCPNFAFLIANAWQGFFEQNLTFFSILFKLKKFVKNLNYIFHNHLALFLQIYLYFIKFSRCFLLYQVKLQHLRAGDWIFLYFCNLSLFFGVFWLLEKGFIRVVLK